MIRLFILLIGISLFFSFDLAKEFKNSSKCKSLPDGSYRICKYVLLDHSNEKLIDLELIGVGHPSGRHALKIHKIDTNLFKINNLGTEQCIGVGQIMRLGSANYKRVIWISRHTGQLYHNIDDCYQARNKNLSKVKLMGDHDEG